MAKLDRDFSPFQLDLHPVTSDAVYEPTLLSLITGFVIIFRVPNSLQSSTISPRRQTV